MEATLRRCMPLPASFASEEPASDPRSSSQACRRHFHASPYPLPIVVSRFRPWCEANALARRLAPAPVARCCRMLRLLRAVVGVALLRATHANPARVCVSKSSTVPFAKRGQAPGPAELNGICSECVRRACRDLPAARAPQVLTQRCVSQLPLGYMLRPRANRRHTEAPVCADKNFGCD